MLCKSLEGSNSIKYFEGHIIRSMSVMRVQITQNLLTILNLFNSFRASVAGKKRENNQISFNILFSKEQHTSVFIAVTKKN